jgi:UDP-N-acetylglucosamine 2-epimerase
MVLFGTRPEAIKLAPVIRELQARPHDFECITFSTGQHREMTHQALKAFDITTDIRLNAIESANTLGQLTARLFQDVDKILAATSPDWVIVQGDTTSAMVGALSAFYRQIRVGHVEARLRTYNRRSPFPEEINRTFITHVGDLHFAPTPRAVQNLRAENVPEESIHLTGNTVVDALLWVSDHVRNNPPPEITPALHNAVEGGRLILVTSHRRESFGQGLENICHALRETVRRHPDVVIVYPVHLNPNVREPVRRLLEGENRIHLLDPLSYPAMVWLMQRCHCIYTDSGGIQEEAPSLGKPVLIMRDTTERPEVIELGCARLVGSSTEAIIAAGEELLANPAMYRAMAIVKNPFGDGTASKRIVDALTAAAKPPLCKEPSCSASKHG